MTALNLSVYEDDERLGFIEKIDISFDCREEPIWSKITTAKLIDGKIVRNTFSRQVVSILIEGTKLDIKVI